MLVCNFCSKNQDEVFKIVLGDNGSAICDQCVVACVEILIADRKKQKESKTDSK